MGRAEKVAKAVGVRGCGPVALEEGRDCGVCALAATEMRLLEISGDLIVIFVKLLASWCFHFHD
jgi:hypothetical protein